VSAAFLCFGVAAGTLTPRVPALKESLHLSDGQVGLSFLAFAVGAVGGAVVSRFVLSRGAALWVRVGTVAMCVALITPALAPAFAWLAAAFFLGGLCAGFLDVLENAQAAEIERDSGRPMINGFHGFWSFGAIIGSIGAALAAGAGLSPFVHFAIVAVVIVIASIPLLSGLPDTRSAAGSMLPSDTTRWAIGTAVGAVAAIAFLGILVESGGADWSAIYLRDFGRTSQGVAAIGYAAFAVAMTAVRFLADRLTARTSPGAVAGLGGLVAALGIGLAIAFPYAPVAIAGFALVGAGAAVMVPLAFSAAANLGRTGTALSVVMVTGYAGSIVGPFLIGTTADRLGLRTALAIPLAAALAVLAVTAVLRPLGRRPGTADGRAR
ncbi:MAG TPA: MFS transporter, partial [Candidatus Dormibacteraeota bacterium]|nr:MFS transporter [Candidatus Dormibacteraeota bacterium]